MLCLAGLCLLDSSSQLIISPSVSFPDGWSPLAATAEPFPSERRGKEFYFSVRRAPVFSVRSCCGRSVERAAPSVQHVYRTGWGLGRERRGRGGDVLPQHLEIKGGLKLGAQWISKFLWERIPNIIISARFILFFLKALLGWTSMSVFSSSRSDKVIPSSFGKCFPYLLGSVNPFLYSSGEAGFALKDTRQVVPLKSLL